MVKYKKVYLDYFDLDISDFIACEVCGSRAIDIHHIEPKGMGGSKTKDNIENLIAVCRGCHIGCHNSKKFNNYAKEIHLKNL